MKASPHAQHRSTNPGPPLSPLQLLGILLLAVFGWTPLTRAQTIGFQDLFTYNAADLNGHAPTTGTAVWTASYSGTGCKISSSGSQAVIVTNGGTPGAGSAVAGCAFQATPNTFYTLRVALQFGGFVAPGSNAWAGFGFSNVPGGGNSGQNTAPWISIGPQAGATDAPGTAGYIGNNAVGSGSLAAANYSAPIAATITWNGATGEARYYLNDLLQWTGTTAPPTTGTFYAWFEGFQTGSAVNLNSIAHTSQTLPLPEVWYAPQDPTDFPNYFSAIVDSGTTPCGWATARSHTNVFSTYNTAFWQGMTTAQNQALISYLKKNSIKLGVCINPLLKTSDPSTWREGFDTIQSHTLAVAAIVAAGGTIDYLSLDSPLGVCYTNTSSTITSVPTLAQSASQTATAIAVYQAVFPNLKVVDFDGIAGFPSADTAAWLADMKALLGKPLDGVIIDFNWYLNYPGQLAGAAATCAAAGVSYGLFYDGFSGVAGSDNNTAQYALGMKINIQSYNAANIPAPAKICFATWGTPATLTCPETTTTNLSALCNLAMTSPYVLQPPPVALLNVWNNSNSFMFTSSYAQYLSWNAQGYIHGTAMGGIAQSPSVGGVAGLVPMYLYYRSSNHAYALSLSSSDAILIAQQYGMQNSLGYVFPPASGAAAGGVPMYEICNQTYYYSVQYSSSPTVPTGWTSNGIKAYLLPGFLHNGFLGYYTPAAIAVPANTTVEATGSNGATVNFTTTATDNVNGAISTTNTPPSGSTFPLGTTTVIAAVSDFGNSGTNSFTVTVRDTTPPAIAVPANISVNASTATGAFVTFATSAIDLVSGSAATASTPASGSFFPIGATTVTTTATDAAGNSASNTFNVTVTVPPVAASEKAAPLAVLSGTALNLTVHSSVPGRTYQLQSSDSLLNGSWLNVGTVQTAGGGDLNLSVFRDTSVSKRFYRFVLGP